VYIPSNLAGWTNVRTFVSFLAINGVVIEDVDLSAAFGQDAVQ
jgi:hypothetical protein